MNLQDLILQQDGPEQYEPGSHVLLLTPTWSEIIRVDPGEEDICAVEFYEQDGELRQAAIVRAFVDGKPIIFPFRVQVGFPEQYPHGSMKIFGLRRLGAGTWVVSPSVNIPGEIHAFVVLCDVPEPPPWEEDPEVMDARNNHGQDGGGLNYEP